MGTATFTREDVEDTALLMIAGELDMANAGELRRCLTDILERGAGSIVLDLGGVTHMDSSGLAELISAHQRASANEMQLVLAVPSVGLRRTIEIRGLDGVFKVLPSRSEALALAQDGA